MNVSSPTLKSPHAINLRTLQALVCSRLSPERYIRNIVESIRGIIFLGTPHGGAGLARWAEILAMSLGLIRQTNPQITQVFQSYSEAFAQIQDSFHVIVRARNQEGIWPIQITCFFEELPLPGIGSVSKSFTNIPSSEH